MCFLYSCKKDANNRIANTTYELDSVVESYLDTLGNETASMRRTMVATPDYINNLPRSSAGRFFEVYTERNDSILVENFSENGCAGIADYNYLIEGRFNSSYHETFQYCNHDVYYRFFQHVNYTFDKKLSSIIYRNMDIGAFGRTDMSDWPSIGNFRSKGHEEITLNYLDNNIHSINYNSIIFNNGYDSVVNQAIFNYGYSHHYKNQKDLIGIDVNDIILSSYLMSFLSRNMYYNPFSDNTNVGLNSFNIPLIINKKASFNTNCEDLIEKFNNPFYESGDGNTYTTIHYEFDNNHSGRIKSIVIYDVIKYTFYYKN